MSNVSVKEEEGLKRLYQAWALFPTLTLSYGDWIHGERAPIGNPCRTAKACQRTLDAWQERNKKKINAWNQRVAKSKRDGSDIRINSRVHQVWPMTENSPWDIGMFESIINDPFA